MFYVLNVEDDAVYVDVYDLIAKHQRRFTVIEYYENPRFGTMSIALGEKMGKVEVYIADENMIRVFTSDGKALRTWVLKNFTRRILFCTRRDELYVLSLDGESILVYSAAGVHLRTLCQREGSEYMADFTLSMEKDELYWVNPNESVIEVFTRNGKFLRKWKTNCVISLCAGPKALFYTDYAGERIYVVSHDGVPLRELQLSRQYNEACKLLLLPESGRFLVYGPQQIRMFRDYGSVS